MGPLGIARFPLSFLLLTLPAAAVAPIHLLAQEGLLGQDSAQVQPAPTPIPPGAIPQRADATQAALQALQDRLRRRDGVTSILEGIPAFIDTVNSALLDPAFRPGTGGSLRALEGTRRRWIPLQVRLTGWTATLTQRSQTLAAERDSLFQTRRLWEGTRDAAFRDSATPALLGRVASVLGEIETTEVLVQGRLDHLVSALDQIALAQRSAGEILSQIDSAMVVARERLLSPDGPPLWRAIFVPADTVTLAGEVRASWGEAVREWTRYTRGSREEIAAVLLAFFVFLLVLHALGRQAKAWEKRGQWPSTPAELEGTRRVLSRPISAAFLLTVLFWRLAYSQPGTSVGGVVMLALVVPVWRLLPSFVTKDLRKPMFGMAALWVVGEGALLIIDGSLLQRLSLLVTASLAGIGLYWAVRPDTPLRAFATRPWWRSAVIAAHAEVVVMGAAVFANVIGYVSLAELLTRATIHSAVAGLVSYTLVTVLDGLIWTLLHTDWARRLQVIRKYSESITARAMFWAHLGVLLLWIGIVLVQFGIQGPVLTAVGAVLGAELSIGTFSVSPGDILAFGVALWLSLLLARGIRSLLEEDVLRSMTLPRGVPAAISTLVHYAAVFIGFLVAAAAAGFDLSRFTLLAGAFGVGLGFGLQNVVNNFVSGLILIFERPVQVGDVVDIGGVQGHVQRIGIRASTVRTWGGAEVIVPNGDLISQQVTNWTLSDRLRRLEIPVGVRYGTDPRRVIDLLTESAGQHPLVLSSPEVMTLFVGFGESSLDFVVRAWTSSDDWRVVQSDLAVAINTALKEAGIEIPFPQRDLHLRSMIPPIRLEGGGAGSDGSHPAQ